MRTLMFLGCLAMLGCEPLSSPPTPAPSATTSAKKETPPKTPVTPPSPTVAAVPPTPVTPEINTLNTTETSSEEPKEEPPEKAPPIPDTFKPLNKNKNLFFEKNGDVRKVHLLAEVCLREGVLEVLLCKRNTKEHESILHVDADAREIHFALIAAGAQPGTPVKFVPQYQAATGSKIKVSLTYNKGGKLINVPAQEWIKEKKTGKDLPHDWVFAGSKFFKDPEKPNAVPYYMANNGEIISLANFPDSMMDLPVKSPKEALDLIYEINTAKIPPLRTPVLLTFELIVEKK